MLLGERFRRPGEASPVPPPPALSVKRRFGGQLASFAEYSRIFVRCRMRVLFYQPNYTGHHLAYLARMLPGFTELPIEILFASTPEAIASQEFAQSLAPFGDRLQLVPCCTTPPRDAVRNFPHRLKDLQKAIRTTRPDHVAACYADGIWETAYGSTLSWPPAVGAGNGRRGLAVSRAICGPGRSSLAIDRAAADADGHLAAGTLSPVAPAPRSVV